MVYRLVRQQCFSIIKETSSIVFLSHQLHLVMGKFAETRVGGGQCSYTIFLFKTLMIFKHKCQKRNFCIPNLPISHEKIILKVRYYICHSHSKMIVLRTIQFEYSSFATFTQRAVRPNFFLHWFANIYFAKINDAQNYLRHRILSLTNRQYLVY